MFYARVEMSMIMAKRLIVNNLKKVSETKSFKTKTRCKIL